MRNEIYNFASAVLIIVLFILLFRSCEKNIDTKQAYAAVNDSLHITRNKMGEQVASIQIIRTENKKQFLELHSKDSIIIALQGIVRRTKNIQSAIIFNASTGSSVNGSTVVHSRDTIRTDSVVYVYPEYSLARHTKWDSVSVRSNKDSTHLEYKIFNNFEITTSYKRSGLFKGKTPVIDITNKNPYTETVALRAYEVKCDCKRMPFFVAGLGIGLAPSIFLLTKNR
jgi:hypothetical protein